MRIRTLSKGATGPEVKWLKSWLNVLVTPSPNLAADDKFDDDTAQAVIQFKIQNVILPAGGVADAHVYAAIWRAITPSLANTSFFGGGLRFDRAIFLDHFLQAFNEVKQETVPNLLNFLGKIEWDDGFQARHIPWVAYMLATTWWETARTFAPIAEGGCDDTGCTPITNPKTGAVNNREYGRPRTCPNLAKTPPGTCPADPTNTSVTHTYYGRGYVQLTHFDTYKSTSRELFRLGLLTSEDQLVHFPEKVMDEDIAYHIISVGLRDGKYFTTQTLGRFIDLGHLATPAQRLAQYKNARALVNGTDHDSDIAAIAAKFEQIVGVSHTEAPHWSSVPAPTTPSLSLGQTSPASVTPKFGTMFPVGPF